MESIGVGPWIAIVVAVGAVGVLVGYWLGAKLGGHNTEPMRELHREQKAYKDEVREHFEQVSATMTRMVDDYRDLYHHVAKGAEKLADMHHETVIEPPPKPEAITRQRAASDSNSERESDAGAARRASATPTTQAAAEASAGPAGTTHDHGKPLDAKQQAPGSSTPSATERPQDAAIRAAAEDAASKR
ncbi:ZapG family protein [Salinicola tamaricis]|uniref:ZapG family protein n=1 Tax=Salinicola tamaricis TaxID=1771309 RepID=UPI000D098A81|nr:DUF1043 family protein [Salinicola tamaricis]